MSCRKGFNATLVGPTAPFSKTQVIRVYNSNRCIRRAQSSPHEWLLATVLFVFETERISYGFGLGRMQTTIAYWPNYAGGSRKRQGNHYAAEVNVEFKALPRMTSLPLGLSIEPPEPVHPSKSL